MTQRATITITSGPDRGAEFHIADELVNIGRSGENEICLADPAVPEHQASIMHRNGRYAIYAAGDESIEIDGSLIPGQRWIWLPEAARLRVSPQTQLTFRVFETPNGRAASEGAEAVPERTADRPTPGGPAAANLSDPHKAASAAPARSRPRDAASAPGKRSERIRSKRQVAQFITDSTGEPLVRLGEDGHLPELALAEGTARPRRAATRNEGSPFAVYAALACSVLLSLVLLLLPDGTAGRSARETARARQEIEQFYERRGGELEPWQRLLREGRLARGRSDRAAEQRAYRRVLEMLNSEEFFQPGAPAVGAAPALTGDRKSDERLRELIAVLLEE